MSKGTKWYLERQTSTCSHAEDLMLKICHHRCSMQSRTVCSIRDEVSSQWPPIVFNALTLCNASATEEAAGESITYKQFKKWFLENIVPASPRRRALCVLVTGSPTFASRAASAALNSEQHVHDRKKCSHGHAHTMACSTRCAGDQSETGRRGGRRLMHHASSMAHSAADGDGRRDAQNDNSDAGQKREAASSDTDQESQTKWCGESVEGACVAEWQARLGCWA
jgi:hypothetical protein